MALTCSPSSTAAVDDNAYNHHHRDLNRNHRRLLNDFENAKAQCLGKRDKSYAGRIDPRAVEVCALINDRPTMYTTSSCSGRCFLYQGDGIKAIATNTTSMTTTTNSSTTFRRYRISHDLVQDAKRYFDLTTLDEDPTGGGDPIRTIGQHDWKKEQQQQQCDDNDYDDEYQGDENDSQTDENTANIVVATEANDPTVAATTSNANATMWLRFEPFILHVACRSLQVASDLMAAARPSFKNVGLTTWKKGGRSYLVAIWGDEGLEMPLSTPPAPPTPNRDDEKHTVPATAATALFTSDEHVAWLADLVNQRHQRNWAKIQRFCESLREMGPSLDENDDVDGFIDNEWDQGGSANEEGHPVIPEKGSNGIPRSFDVIGDIAYLHSLPETVTDPHAVGIAIMNKNKSIKLVVMRNSKMEGTERTPGQDGLSIIAGANRSPLITTHTEFGIRCVVDLNHTFFSPRMGPERLRICQQVARGEDVLVCFAGVGMDAIQIAGRTEASTVVAVELNPAAVECARRGHRMLERNKAVKCPGAAERLEIVEGDVLQVLPAFESKRGRGSFDRILAPRPKEGTLDGDLGSGDGGRTFLMEIVKNLKEDGGECHWYDFVADHEFPVCHRTRALIERVCQEQGSEVQILHVARVGSVAMRQFRVCVDFRLG